MTTPDENTDSSRADDLNSQNDPVPNADVQPALPTSAEQEPEFALTFADPDQEETAEAPLTQSADAQGGQDQEDMDCPISEDTKTCPEPHWIEIELRDEKNQPVSGVYAVYIDSAGKEHNMVFNGQAILRKNVAKGKGRLVLRRSILYNKGLTLPQRPEGSSSLVEPKVPEKKGYKETERTYILASWHEELKEGASKTEGEVEKQLETLQSYVIEIEGIKPELVLVVGAQYDEQVANKLIFAGHAIRDLRRLPKRPATVLMFSARYKRVQLDEVKKSSEDAGAVFEEVTSFEAFKNYINTRNFAGGDIQKRYRNPVGELRFYCHGLISNIAIGYRIDDNLNLTLANFTVLDPKAFSHEGSVYSFACRTGMGPNHKADREEPNDDRKNSLAQMLANRLKITVYAYIRRSEYKFTWNTPFERQQYFTCSQASWTDRAYSTFNQTSKASDDFCKNYVDQMNTWDGSIRDLGAMYLPDGARYPVMASEADDYNMFSGRLEPFTSQ